MELLSELENTIVAQDFAQLEVLRAGINIVPLSALLELVGGHLQHAPTTAELKVILAAGLGAGCLVDATMPCRNKAIY